MKIFSYWLFTCCFIITPTVLYTLPAQVIIVRHAEKDPRVGLNQQGQERAGALAYYLTQTDYLLNFGLPAAIFASRPTPRKSNSLIQRVLERESKIEIETIMPTAALLKLPLHSSFQCQQVTEMANLILKSNQYDGRNIVICWNHVYIYDLLKAFGYQAPLRCMYPGSRYDLAFVLTFPAPQPSGRLPYATIYFQQLIFGDLTCQSACNPPNLPPSPCYFNSPDSPLAALVCSTP